MNKKFTESKAVSAIKQHENGISVKEICKEFGISNATFYNWKSKFGALDADDVKKVYELERENIELKKMFAELGLENRALKNQLEKKNWEYMK
ncbi:MAG: transposase [Bacteroidota bacterium]